MGKTDLIIKILELDLTYDEETLSKMSVGELEEILKDCDDNSDMFPNGRDYDAEDEDCF